MTDLIEERFELGYEDEPSRVLRGRVTRPANTDTSPFVLVLHGFKGFMDWGFFPGLARRLARAGFAAVAFNGSGSGIGPDLLNFTEEDNFARDTVTRQLEDIERVRERIDNGGIPGVAPGWAGLFGHSRGGGVGLIHAAERGDYRAVVTWAAIDTVHRWDESTREEWRRLGHIPVVNSRTGQTLRMDLSALEDLERNRDRFDIEASCGRITAPTLVCHGDADEAVEFGALDRIVAALPVGAALPVQGGGHTFGARHPMAEGEGAPAELEFVLSATTEWFRNHLS